MNNKIKNAFNTIIFNMETVLYNKYCVIFLEGMESGR